MRAWGAKKNPNPGPGHRAAAIVTVMAVALLFGAPSAVADVTYDPATDVNSMFNTTQYTGATAWWNAGYTGAGG